MEKNQKPKNQKNQQEPQSEKDYEEKLADLEERLKRALADYQNLEKRFAKESEKIIRFANAALLTRLLEPKDNLERAAQNLQDDGLNLVLDQLEEILSDEEVKKIKAEGKKFDPELMEVEEAVEGKKDKVIEVIQRGYKLRNRILRPAKVKVGKGKQTNNKKNKNKKD